MPDGTVRRGRQAVCRAATGCPDARSTASYPNPKFLTTQGLTPAMAHLLSLPSCATNMFPFAVSPSRCSQGLRQAQPERRSDSETVVACVTSGKGYRGVHLSVIAFIVPSCRIWVMPVLSLFKNQFCPFVAATASGSSRKNWSAGVTFPG
jgi:hypothetical protein